MTGRQPTVISEFWWVRLLPDGEPEVMQVDFTNGKASHLWGTGNEFPFKPEQVEFLALVRLPEKYRKPRVE